MTNHASTDTTAALRQARRRARLAESGTKPLTLLAPKEAHPFLNDIATRLRSGEPLVNALARAFHRANGNTSGLVQHSRPALAVPADLQPGPGEVAVAVRLVKHASGGLRRWLASVGLVRREEVFGWAGVLSRDAADELQRRVQAASGTVIERAARPAA